MPHQRIPILVYHHVYPEDAPELQSATHEMGAGIIGRTQFVRQMKFIEQEGWNVVATSRVVDWLAGTGRLPSKAVALHFDNGWLDTATVVRPILAEMGFTATCFPITDGLEAASSGHGTTVRTLTEGMIRKPFITWDQARQLLEAGWELGAHTATHCKVADAHHDGGDEAVTREAEVSNGLFRDRLGFVPEHFAYPSGSRNARTDELLANHYRSLRLWRFDWPIHWTFTDHDTSLQGIECQNIDLRVGFEDFRRVFTEATATEAS